MGGMSDPPTGQQSIMIYALLIVFHTHLFKGIFDHVKMKVYKHLLGIVYYRRRQQLLVVRLPPHWRLKRLEIRQTHRVEAGVGAGVGIERPAAQIGGGHRENAQRSGACRDGDGGTWGVDYDVTRGY